MTLCLNGLKEKGKENRIIPQKSIDLRSNQYKNSKITTQKNKQIH